MFLRSKNSKSIKSVERDPISCTKSINSVLTSIKAGLNIFISQKSPKMPFLVKSDPQNDPYDPRWEGLEIKKGSNGLGGILSNAQSRLIVF